MADTVAYLTPALASSDTRIEHDMVAPFGRYISSPAHLKDVMKLLRDRSASIQYEAFHVFKIFVANPRKEGTVLQLLQRNKAKLLQFLPGLLSSREQTDENFRDEKSFLIDEIHRLPD